MARLVQETPEWQPGPPTDLPASVMSLLPLHQLGITDWYVLIVLPGQEITALSTRQGLQLVLLLGFSAVAAAGWRSRRGRSDSEPEKMILCI